MLYSPAFIFSSGYLLGFFLCAGLRLGALRWFQAFLASSARSACASSFCFCSILGLAVVANRSVKPTRLRRAAYFRSLGKEIRMSDWDFLHEMHNRGYSSADIADAAGCGYAPWEAVHIAEQETAEALKELQSLRSAQEISREEFLKARAKILGHRSV